MLVTHFVASPLWADAASMLSQLYILFLHWFPHINNSVIIYKTLFICVNFVTMVSLEWLIPCMSLHMLFMDMNIWESFSTFFTVVWFLSSMYHPDSLASSSFFSPVCFQKCFWSLLFGGKYYHIGNIHMVLPQSGISSEFQRQVYKWKPCYIDCMFMAFIQCVNTYDLQYENILWNPFHTLCIDMVSFLCEIYYDW